MSTRKFLALVVTVVAATVGGLAWFSGQVEAALVKHSEHPHAVTAAVDTAQGLALARLEGVPGDLRALRGRIDLLVQQGAEHAKGNLRSRREWGRAAETVRRAAKSRGEQHDPLAGVEGL